MTASPGATAGRRHDRVRLVRHVGAEHGEHRGTDRAAIGIHLGQRRRRPRRPPGSLPVDWPRVDSRRRCSGSAVGFIGRAVGERRGDVRTLDASSATGRGAGGRGQPVEGRRLADPQATHPAARGHRDRRHRAGRLGVLTAPGLIHCGGRLPSLSGTHRPPQWIIMRSRLGVGRAERGPGRAQPVVQRRRLDAERLPSSRWSR